MAKETQMGALYQPRDRGGMGRETSLAFGGKFKSEHIYTYG